MTSELNVKPETPFSAESRWGVFGHSAFVVILAATSLSNIGFAMFDTGSGWLMTSLNPSPRMVSAVQIATTLPLFLLTLPAGALTDVVDPRRLLIVAQAGVAAVSFGFAAAVSVGLASPAALLATSFLLGVGGALAAPAWLLILPVLVARTELDSAVAVDSASYSLARAVGPVIAGFAIARLRHRRTLLVLLGRKSGAGCGADLVARSAKVERDPSGRTADQCDDDGRTLRSI